MGTLLCFMAVNTASADDDKGRGPPFGSTAGTVFDIIRTTDASTFSCLKYAGRFARKVWDKRVDGEPRINAFLFHAHYSEGSIIKILVNPEFKNVESARTEALRYTNAIGQLPVDLRRGIKFFSIHQGDEGFHAGDEQIVVYADKATLRMSQNHLEESIFHEAVHASWDKDLRLSAKWMLAQKNDNRFLTKYGMDKPEREDLAETALFAYAILHHPGRIPPVDTEAIQNAVPERIKFISELLPTDQPVISVAAVNPECT